MLPALPFTRHMARVKPQPSSFHLKKIHFNNGGKGRTDQKFSAVEIQFYVSTYANVAEKGADDDDDDDLSAFKCTV